MHKGKKVGTHCRLGRISEWERSQKKELVGVGRTMNKTLSNLFCIVVTFRIMAIFCLLKILKIIIKIHPDVVRTQTEITTVLILFLVNDTATLKRVEKNYPK